MRAARAWIVLLALTAACGPRLTTPLPPAPTQLFLNAEAAFDRGDYQPAADAYSRFLRESPDHAYVARASYRLALAQYHLHDYEGTLTTLDGLKQHEPKQGWVQTLALRGDAEQALGHRVPALLTWEEAWLVASPADQPHLRERIEPLAQQLTEDERRQADESITVPAVRSAAGLSPATTVASLPAAEVAAPPTAELEEEETPVAMAGEESATSAAAPGPAEARPMGETAKAAAPPQAEAEAGEIGSAAAAAPPAEPASVAASETAPSAKVACLLPLTGPDHAYGQRSLAGLRLAFADAPEQLVVRDTGGDPAITKDLLKSLDRDPEVVAVIGPLRSSEAEVTAPLAERDQLPVLLLSQREGLTGRYVLQMAMTRTQQVQLLVGYATNTLKLERFGVLYPDDGYGVSFNRVFGRVLGAGKGKLVGARAYQPGEPDFAEIGAVVRRWQASGLQAVFIPDGAGAAAAVATQVRHEMPQVVLLGTESWNNPDLLAKAGANVDGAVFGDAFFAGSDRPSTRQFVERFERGAGRAPTVFEAQAFDAGLAIRRVIAQGATTRDQVIGQLQALGSVEGAGELRGTPSGFQRALSLLRYKNGKVEEIVPRTDG